MNIRTQYCKTQDGHSIAFAVVGEGPPVVVAGSMFGDVHMIMATDAVRRFYPRHNTRRVILHDGLGMGASDHGGTDYSLRSKLRDLDTVVDHLELDRFAIFGQFNGVPSAIAYAAAHPDQITSMILVNGAASGREWYSVPSMRISDELSAMAEEQWESFTMAIAAPITGYERPEVAAEFAALMRSSMSASEHLAYQREFSGVDVRDLLPKIQAPTLLLNVKNLLPGVLPLMREMATAIPGATLVEATVEDATKVIEDFLADHDVLEGSAQTAIDRAAVFRTILFTDLVGHTEMMQRLGDGKGREVLREHERITRECLAAHGGAEVKTMGDGFMASFGSVTKAVECAVALQRAVEQWNSGTGEQLAVRCGLNAGEPIEEDGDLFGSTVILASRIAAAAQGGEVLASMAVRELCAGKGFAFADRGEQAMRGFEDPVRVFEVSWRA